MGRRTIESAVERAVAASLRGERHVVLAVSGGADSMVLMYAAAAAMSGQDVTVATFDHGTGRYAADSVRLVRSSARALGFRVRAGKARNLPRGEASWRQARWQFLRGVAAPNGARIVTAHTQDDHIETVVMRLMRGAEARGIAGLLAPSDVARPLLGFTRMQLREYARRRAVPWLDDPANSDPSFLRNRVRLQFLPALQRANPKLPEELLRLSIRAAELRRQVEAIAGTLSKVSWPSGDVTVPADALQDMTRDELALIWPAILARCGAVADRRGIVRLSEWTRAARTSGRIPLSGGFEVVRRKEDFVVRRARSRVIASCPLSKTEVTTLGEWRFYPIELTTIRENDLNRNPWLALLEADRSYEVRVWRAGDRMETHPQVGRRRVARFFEDQSISGPDREGWPVVTAGSEVVWIPGVRRGSAATARSGGPLVTYRCEHNVS